MSHRRPLALDQPVRVETFVAIFVNAVGFSLAAGAATLALKIFFP